MDDLISRKAAIGVAESHRVERPGFHLNDYEFGVTEAADAIASDLEDLPLVQQWIPCSERMPDTDYGLWSEPVLVTRKGKDSNGEEWYVVEKANYCGKLLSSDGKYRDTPGWAIGTNTYSTDYIIAWKPLPEPYKVEETT